MPKVKVRSLAVAHAALLKDVHKLEKAISSPKEDSAATRAILKEIKQHVAEHFKFEEENVYMDQVREHCPNKEGTVLKLYKEHRHLEQALDALIEEARKPMDDGFREIVQKWIEQIRRHESQENTLIQETLNLEMGDQD